MSCCKRTDGTEQFPCSGCYANNCGIEKKRCSISNSEIHFCFCRNNRGYTACIDSNSFHPTDTSAMNACSESCQCAEEMVWNSNKPPKPDCKWFSNFSELRRQWSKHARQQNCKCCNYRQEQEYSF